MSRYAFYCSHCTACTVCEPRNEDDTSALKCGRCGEPYACEDCGFEIDVDGNCLRFNDTDDDTCVRYRERAGV
jgi:hypothetical protein